MKKIILLIMLLLSGLANATRIYDHVSAYRTILEGTRRLTTNLQYIATYTITEAQEQQRYVGVFSTGSPQKEYILERGRRVNNIRSYDYTFDGETYHLTFIAMDGALYMMVNGEKPFIISTDIEDKDNVIDILKDDIGFTVVDNQTTETGQINTRLMSFYMVKRRGFILPFNSTIFTIKGEKAMSAGSIMEFSDESYSSALVLVTDKNLYRLERRSIDRWDRISQDEIDKNDKIRILPSNGMNVFLVKYNTKTKKWSYLNNIIKYVEPKDFIPLNINQEENYFDYAVISSLNRAVMGAFFVSSSGSNPHGVNLFEVNYHGKMYNFTIRLHHQSLVSANTFFSNSTAQGTGLIDEDPEALYLTKSEGEYMIFANMKKSTVTKVVYLYSLPM